MRALACLALLIGVCSAAPSAHAQVGMLIGAVKYVPNRVLDALDLVRLRARVGPGNAVELRAGDRLELFRGRYTSLFAGLPGPRSSKWPRSPAGIETRARGEDGGSHEVLAWTDPDYGKSECALGFQAFVLGLELGVDPLQILDFGFGLIGLDPGDDDW